MVRSMDSETWDDGDLDQIRAENVRRYGRPTEARAYAEDLGASYCEECGAVYPPIPGYINSGHQCDRDGLTPEHELPTGG